VKADSKEPLKHCT